MTQQNYRYFYAVIIRVVAPYSLESTNGITSNSNQLHPGHHNSEDHTTKVSKLTHSLLIHEAFKF